MIQLEKIPQCQGEAWKDKLEQFKDQGCRIFGYIEVAKVAGNFHIAPGSILKGFFHLFSFERAKVFQLKVFQVF